MPAAEKEKDYSTVQLEASIKERLVRLGRMHESYNDVVERLLDERELTPQQVAEIHAGQRACPTCGTQFAGVTGA